MTYDAKTDWQYGQKVTETDANRWERGIADAHKQLDPAPSVPITLTPGVSIVHSDRTSQLRDMRIEGRTLVNLLGRDGNFEDISRWQKSPDTSVAASPSTAKYGMQAIGVQANTTSMNAFVYRAITLDTSKKYVLVGEGRSSLNLVFTVGTSAASGVGGGATPVFTSPVGDNSKYGMAYVKFQPTAANLYVSAFIYGTSTTAAAAGFDGIRLYEITQAEYNALDTMTTDQVAAKYPYVDDMKHVNAVYVQNPGKNLLPPLSEWALFSSSTIIENYKIEQSKNTSGFHFNSCIIKAVAGQTYTLSTLVSNIGGSGTGAYIEAFRADASGNVGNVIGGSQTALSGFLKYTFTVPADSYGVQIRLTLNDDARGTFTFLNPMLNIGPAALPFEPPQPSYMYMPDCNLRSNVDGSVKDQLYTDGEGKPRAVRRFREIPLDGSRSWGVDALATVPGGKQVYFRDGTINSPDFNGTCIKYDGSILVTRKSLSDPLPSDSFTMYLNGGVHIAIANANSGWGPNYSPTTGEIQAYFNGWVMVDQTTWNTNLQPYNGTGTRGWVKRWVGVGTKSTLPSSIGVLQDGTGIATLPTDVINSGWTPYRLMYQLAQSVDEPVTYEGSLVLHDGPNQIEVGTGIVVREAAKPAMDTNSNWYEVNRTDAGYEGSKLSKRVNKIQKAYKNQQAISVTIVSKGSYATENGERFYTRDIDSTTAYSVTYLALDTYALGTAPQSITGTLTPNIKETVDDAVTAISGLCRDVSVLQNTKAPQPQWIAPTLVNSWVAYSGLLIGYVKDIFGFVHLRGIIAGGATTFGSVIFTLPVGYRPAQITGVTTLAYNGSDWSLAKLTIGTAGNVFIDSAAGNTQLILDGISFRAEQ
ncbi:hypothetical protein ACFFNY_21860 [Paenibacillus hodogayensis]|uniref:Uncharacterized protein n=1 Tax=Paenibacillus hodogayensis TaxID=279208 RepID=A0ABV5W100_9BACL